VNPIVKDDILNKGTYYKLLTSIAQLSRLFSENSTPYLNYRVAENAFCIAFNAENLSRNDLAYDAKIGNLGIGLKTFIATNKESLQKVAEFNKNSYLLKLNDNLELASQIAKLRNERINLAKRLLNISESSYHIVGRRESSLIIYETPYETININNIKIDKRSNSSLIFNDGINKYNFNFSKSTLLKSFVIPKNYLDLKVEIIEDPFELLLNLNLNDYQKKTKHLEKGIDYILLPLYSTKGGQKTVFQKSGLNQWNAAGRKRDFGEVYIPIPSQIRKTSPEFFPVRDKPFNLKLPDGKILSAKVCQDNSKALMTNPNNALSDWLLRKVLNLKEGELATYDKLLELGFDSIYLEKVSEFEFAVNIRPVNSYEKYIEALNS